MMGSQPWDMSFVPPYLTENLAELFPGLTIEEALQHQESLYQSLKVGCVNLTTRSSGNGNGSGSSQNNSWRELWAPESGGSDVALDEALARSLQELDLVDELDHAAVAEPVQRTVRNAELTAASASVSGTNHNDIDPDLMTYEELQSLGEAIGSASRGLSETEISSLPCYKYKTGLFSKKIQIGECVICYSSYKNRQSVTSLPCLHQYHSECINHWLRQNKTCPICQKEVKFHEMT